MSNLQRNMFAKNGFNSSIAEHQARRNSKDLNLSPLPWSDYFERKDIVVVPNQKDNSIKDKFNVYFCGKDGPLLLLLHGGGFSGLSWALFSVELMKRCKCQIAAPDLRGHGDTIVGCDESDWSTATQCKDISNIVETILKSRNIPETPVIVVGHSMGGAIATHLSKGNYIPSLVAIVVIDVVEGTALAALPAMKSILKGRPREFASIEDAIEWAVKTGHIRNINSARVSMPGQLSKVYNNSKDLNNDSNNNNNNGSCNSSSAGSSGVGNLSTITEQGFRKEVDEFWEQQHIVANQQLKYTWRANLEESEQYWAGWFTGMSSAFLTTSHFKLLFVAGVDRLDKDLIIGQMQGKFQTGILPTVGHAVHEDAPDRTAQILVDFLARFKVVDMI